MEQKIQAKHIAIAGNIGAGKTTLCGMLAEYYDWDVHYESTDDNPYLSDFYEDMKRWSFHLQIYFLNSRYTQIIKIQQGERTVVQDRTIYEDAHIFAPNLRDMGLMSSRDFNNYSNLFETMNARIAPPDLLIYLRGSIPTLVDHIQGRGRDYEGNISLDYLRRLNERYEDWIKDYDEGKLLIIDIDGLNFKEKTQDFQRVVKGIEEALGVQ